MKQKTITRTSAAGEQPRGASLFSQILNIVDRAQFEAAVRQTYTKRLLRSATGEMILLGHHRTIDQLLAKNQPYFGTAYSIPAQLSDLIAMESENAPEAVPLSIPEFVSNATLRSPRRLTITRPSTAC